MQGLFGSALYGKLEMTLRIYHFKLFQNTISIFIKTQTDIRIVWGKGFAMHFAPCI